MILFPLFLSWKEAGKSLISRLATLFEKPWAFLLLFLPLAAVDIIIDALGLGFSRVTGGWSFLSYVLFLIYGSLIFSNTLIQEIIRKYSSVALIVAVVLSFYSLVMQFVVKWPLSFGTSYYISVMLVRALRSLCWIVVILGFGSRFLNFNNKFLGYANEAVLPFYVLHQTIILIVGFYVIQSDMSIAAKYWIITPVSFVAIMSIYELLIRRTNVFRFLFGMRMVKHKG